MKFARKQHPTVYNRVDLCVTIHKPILLGGLVLFNDKNKKYEKIRKNTNASLKFEIRIRIFLSWTGGSVILRKSSFEFEDIGKY